MREQFSHKHPYVAAIIAAVIVTAFAVAGNVVAAVFHLFDEDHMAGYYITLGISNIICCILAWLYALSKEEGVALFRFNRISTVKFKKMWFLLPLLIELLVMIFGAGINTSLKSSIVILIFLFTLTVGFAEEMYFRGLVLHFLTLKGNRKAVLIGSLIFGLIHLSTSLRGDDVILVVIPRIIFAFVFGLVASEVMLLLDSIWPVIIWHCLHDFTAYVTRETVQFHIAGVSDVFLVMVVELLELLVLIIYAIYLWKLLFLKER